MNVAHRGERHVAQHLDHWIRHRMLCIDFVTYPPRCSVAAQSVITIRVNTDIHAQIVTLSVADDDTAAVAE